MDSGPARPPAPVAGPFRLEAFRALGLSPHRVGDPASARAFARPYRDVGSRLRRWERQGHLTRDTQPAVYLHEYAVGGLTVRGLVGALDVSRRASPGEQQVVLPHEGVHDAQADELAARMTQMQVNPAPILLVHRGPAAVRALVHDVMAGPPDREFTDRAERHNRLWAIRAPELLARLREDLADARPLIADGHHRYEAYLRMQEADPGSPADRGLAMLVDQDDTPLFLGAIHRTVADTSLPQLGEAVEGIAELSAAAEPDAMAALGPSTLVVTDGREWARLELRLPDSRAAVEVLHEELLPRLPGKPRRVTYHHSVEDTLQRLTRRRIAVLMPAPDFDLVGGIVADHRVLPEKATSFQPKPSLGVIMRSLRDG
ncbi:DUF1015 family protein [Nocardioides coralli]|uniref:DUF1015 family protein n=1 Tax=Nocardioides coralli TaxID=2872154 RepID=UPI001CA40581|nr:DUF1015 family protein [Nocardioides coralli]QZY30571.1 DUF1015 domain-containing protein [Nocardioides coralli]